MPLLMVMTLPNRHSCAMQKYAHPTCISWGKWLSIRILHTPHAPFTLLLSNSRKCCQVTLIQIQVCIKSLALYGENHWRGLKIQRFVTLTELVMARLNKRSSSTCGYLERLLDWIYIGFAVVDPYWVLLWVLVDVCESWDKEKRMLRQQWNPQPTFFF